MKKEDYISFINGTISSFSSRIKQHLVRTFMGEGIASDRELEGQLTFTGDSIIAINGHDLNEKVSLCISKSDKAVKLYEKWEFTKGYRYSVLYDCDEFENVYEEVAKVPILDANTLENDYMWPRFDKPVAYHLEQMQFLKYNRQFSAPSLGFEGECFLKYPFIVVLHKKHKIVEFRFDTISRIFLTSSEADSIYDSMVSEIKKMFEDAFNCKLTSVDLDFMVNLSKQTKDVKLIAQFMELSDGGHAELNVGNNEEYLLPFIGAIKNMMAEYVEELNHVPKFKGALEQYMYELEEGSDCPWIELLWENEIKTRNNHVKIIFNYKNRNYARIQYYSSVLIGMGRMNDVVEYIVNHRGDDTSTS